MPSLPIVNCDGCGVCCLHMGYPSFVRATATQPDEEHWLRLPQDLKSELTAFMETYEAPADGQLDSACCWFDHQTRGCKHYEHRPRVCRDFKVGCSDCLGWREQLLHKTNQGDTPSPMSD